MSDIITCPQCKGRGETLLESAFKEVAEVLEILRERGPSTATEIQPLLKKQILVTGVNNRLEDLRHLGFAVRSKQGREWLYEAAL